MILLIAALAAAPDGATLFRQCTACHALEPGANTAAAPTLYRVVGRRVAAEKSYNYSPALRRFATANPRWTPELLDRFIAAPDKVVPGTEMGFPGLADAAKRQTLIDWLRRQ
jgi:cytochrome c